MTIALMAGIFWLLSSLVPIMQTQDKQLPKNYLHKVDDIHIWVDHMHRMWHIPKKEISQSI